MTAYIAYNDTCGPFKNEDEAYKHNKDCGTGFAEQLERYLHDNDDNCKAKVLWEGKDLIRVKDIDGFTAQQLVGIVATQKQHDVLQGWGIEITSVRIDL